MKIRKLRTTYSGREGLTKAGTIIDVPPDRARSLIDAGYARALDLEEGEPRLGTKERTAAGRPAGEKKEQPARPLSESNADGGQTSASKSSSSAAPGQARGKKSSKKRAAAQS